MNEITSYQSVDKILGMPKKAARKPLRGFTVLYADLGCIGHFTMQEEMQAAIDSLKSKYEPQIFRSWIHNEDNKRHWTPR